MLVGRKKERPQTCYACILANLHLSETEKGKVNEIFWLLSEQLQILHILNYPTPYPQHRDLQEYRLSNLFWEAQKFGQEMMG